MPCRFLVSVLVPLLGAAYCFLSPDSVGLALAGGLSGQPGDEAGANGAAGALQVYPGCATLRTKPNHVWYIDPVRGSAAGDGSANNPWNSLQAVVSSVGGASPLLATAPYWHRGATGWTWAPNVGAPVKPGDAILLMSGDYGSVFIDVHGQTIANSDFVTVEAAPGQTPVLASLSIGAANKWRFKGIKVQALAAGNAGLVNIGGQSPALPSTDIILDGLDISSQDDVKSWTPSDWLAKGRVWGLRVGISPDVSLCTAVENTKIQNVRNGAALGGTKTLFANNTMDRLGDDFIDYFGNDLIIRHNTLTNSLTLGDGNHNDFMQGQIGARPAGASSSHYSNILIDSNLAIRQTDPDLNLVGIMQGIDAFDEDWHNVTVSNNIVITSACHGISYSSLHGGLIVNNTVLADGLVKTPGDCNPLIYVGDKTHEGSSSNDVLVRNNIVSGMTVDNRNSNVMMDHNLCTTLSGRCLISYFVGGKQKWYREPGVYGDRQTATENHILRGGPGREFVNYEPKQLVYDVRLRPAARALGAGSPDRAPAVNFDGAARGLPTNVGAY
jgi:hypothetical protein